MYRSEKYAAASGCDGEYDAASGRLTIKGVSDFDPVHIFECGQCFRWLPEEDGSYTGVTGDRAVSITYEKGVLTVCNCREEDAESFWYDYFDLGRDYGQLKHDLADGDDIMKQASGFGGGIRLLRQDPWETVISFIISQNSNIPRIRQCIDSLCRNFGQSLGEWRGEERFSFPSAERLAELEREDLSVCRLGYRDRYVLETARAVARDQGKALAAARDSDPDAAAAYIRSLSGVGPKVADCILLFGLQHYGSFPLDVWMKRIMTELYGFDPKDTRGMSEYARLRFGENSGFAQQYLFYYAKENLKNHIDNKTQKR